MDVADLLPVRTGLASFDGTIDALVMNAVSSALKRWA